MTLCQHTRGSRLAEAAKLVAAAIGSDNQIDRPFLNQVMTEIFGSDGTDGRWSQRDSFEALELGLTIALTRMPLPDDASTRIATLAELTDRLPTMTVRSETQVDWQQFSTPPAIAQLAVELAGLTSADTVLEPSAGTGIIAALAGRSGASIHINELEPGRAEALSAIFPNVTRTDAAQLSNATAIARPSVILMNPPFARSGGTPDPLTAARHLQSALRFLLPGGRLVIIAPENLANTGKHANAFRRAIDGNAIRHSLLLQRGAYAKHGTSVAIRIYAIDKVVHDRTPSTYVRNLPLELWKALPRVAPREPVAAPTSELSAPVRTDRARKPGLFRAAALSRQPVKPPAAHDTLQARPVVYRPLDEPSPLPEAEGIYIGYRPSRVVFPSACKHPSKLVESIAMASIAAPIPNVEIVLPPDVVTKGVLSDAQLETVLYANQAWSRTLPHTFRYDAKTSKLVPDADGRAYRFGFFLADGTGAGKGRQVAACILGQRLAGNRKHVWISQNETLVEDAQRDWRAVGGVAADIVPLSRWKIDEDISLPEGILFIPYGTLRSEREAASRLEQIIRWAGDDYEGVIAFDESHAMGGAAGGEGAFGERKGSLQGIAGVALQNRLPSARVLYVSATGASDVNNLAYAPRLGLWGPGTAFSTREQFITEIRAGGIAAMELVARDLKASGLYFARALSFAGVEYDILQHHLTSEQIAIYNQYADAWAIIHANLELALEETNIVDSLSGDTNNAQAKAAALSRFEGSKQRFFSQLLLSMKLPTLLPAIDSHLAQNESVVVQLVSTAEAALDRRLAGMSAEDMADLDIDLSPREAVVEYLARAFPVLQHETYLDEQGELRSRLAHDKAGNPVINAAAEAARDALIEQLCAMPAIATALDAIILRFGPDAVSEVTGRSRRVITAANGSQRIESRSGRVNISETNAFMDGEKRILVFSNAGGTGRSYHASLLAKNQQRRVHFLIEPGWRADIAIQGLGRTNRTHQAHPPLFRPVTTDCRGELRFTSTIARRLDSLGALTRGQRQTGGQNLFDPNDNLESVYAKAALVEWYHLLFHGKLDSVGLKEFEGMTGLRLTSADGLLEERLPPIQRWLNRILALRIEVQNAIFDEFMAIVETRTQAAKKAGTYDHGVESTLVEHAEILANRVIRTDPSTGATTHLLTIDATWKRRTYDRNSLLERWPNARRMLNEKSMRSGLCKRSHARMDESGNTIPYYEILRPTGSTYVAGDELAESNWIEISDDRHAEIWTEEIRHAEANPHHERVNLVTGLLLPVWGHFRHEDLTVTRLVDRSGHSWLGRYIADIDLDDFLTQLGIGDFEPAGPDTIVPHVLGGGQWTLRSGMTIKHSRVNGNTRIEITGFDHHLLAHYKSLGCWTEIISFKTRLFVPSDNGDAVLRAILAR